MDRIDAMEVFIATLDEGSFIRKMKAAVLRALTPIIMESRRGRGHWNAYVPASFGNRACNG